MTPARSATLRTQILFMLLGGAILPLAIVGIWLSASAVRSGESLLRSHLEESADRFASAVSTRWNFRAADISLFAENEATLRILTHATHADGDVGYLNGLALNFARTIPTLELRDSAGRVRWGSSPLSRAADARARGGAVAPAGTGTTVRVEAPVLDEHSRVVGLAVADVALAAIIPPDSARPLVPGARVGIRNARTNAVLLRIAAESEFATTERTFVRGKPWIVAHRAPGVPPLEIAIAAPLAPYVAPFQSATRSGIVALIAVSILAVVITGTLAKRATVALEELARASTAVSGGSLDQQVVVAGPAEVRDVGAAFNTMTSQLRTTLDTLSKRSALAAVGEFATALSHDVRNALTSIKVDLERLSMRPAHDAAAEGLVRRLLNSVERLEASVTGALRVARRDNAPKVSVDVRAPLRAAIERVQGAFDSVSARLTTSIPAEPVIIVGDAPGLEQVFANLLFNAVQALRPGGSVHIALSSEAGAVHIVVRDDGSGISEADLPRLDTPFFSTKPTGTGLGLPIVRQIVASHGGRVSIESAYGAGTSVTVTIPDGTIRPATLNDSSNRLANVP